MNRIHSATSIFVAAFCLLWLLSSTYAASTNEIIETCNRLSGAPLRELDAAATIAACERAVQISPTPRQQYQYGRGLDKAFRVSEAVQWFRKAAEQGHAGAQNFLGVKYATGSGVRKDLRQAVHWYRKAAEGGHAIGQANLGYMYLYGQGVSRDYQKALHWYRKAAEQGDARGQLYLGVSYWHGRGVLKDKNEARKWLLRAQKSPDRKIASAATYTLNEDRRNANLQRSNQQDSETLRRYQQERQTILDNWAHQ